MHPAIYQLRAHMRPGEQKFLWKRSYYFNTVWRKFKHGYFGMDTMPHTFYGLIPVVFSLYMIFGDLYGHPDIDASWLLLEPMKSFFEHQGAYRSDFHQEGQTYRFYDHSLLGFGLKGKHRSLLESGLDVNCPTSAMYGRRVLKADEIVDFEGLE